MDNQCYFNGEFWQCVTTTVAGESPTSAPAKWRKIRIPKEWRRVLAKLTFANLLELDGQTDKAKIHRDTGEALLDDLVREAARQENDRHSGSVRLPQGQAIAASVILDDAYGLMRWALDDLEDSEKADGRRSLSMAVQQFWEAWWWESLMVFEEKALRPTFDFVSLTKVYAPVTSSLEPGGNDPEVYFPPNKKYYQVLAPTFAQAETPAALVNGEYVTNDLFWAECARCYSAGDYVDEQSYALASRVRNPKDDKFYQKVGGVTAGNAGTADVNASYTMVEQVELATVYESLPDLSGLQIIVERIELLLPQVGYNWSIFSFNPDTEEEVFLYHAAAPGVTNVEDVTGWTSGDSPGGNAFVGVLPAPTFTAQGAPPPVAAQDAAPFWGRLTPWVPTLDYPRTVRQVTREDPRTTCRPHRFHFDLQPNGILIPEVTCGTVWLEARRATPVIAGNDFDPATTYDATPQDELVYDS